MPVHKLGDNTIVIGDDLFEGLTTPQDPPTQAALDTILAPATRVEVREVHDEKPLLAAEDPPDLEALRGALRIRDGGVGHCMCFGSLELGFSQGRTQLGTVTLHHGVSVRWQPFFENAELVDPEPLLDWLSAHGIESLREEYQESLDSEGAADAAKARWRAAMPPVLEPAWDSMREPLMEWPAIADLLAEKYPDPVERARVLLRWLGHGEGPWSGCPSYEYVPEWCLFRMPLDVLIEAAEAQSEDEAIREGAARLFAHWEFARDREPELARIPAELRRALLEHALRSDDEDKRARARAAFEDV